MFSLGKQGHLKDCVYGGGGGEGRPQLVPSSHLSSPHPSMGGQSSEAGVYLPWDMALAGAEGFLCGHTSSLPLAMVAHMLFLFPREKDGIRKAREILVRLGLDPTHEDCVATHRVCQIVSTRSASLCAATLAAVLRRIKENKGVDRLRSTVGVDGSVYKKHPQ